jgi:hypothetical protein
MQPVKKNARRKEEEGLHGVFKRLRRNGHQLKKEAANKKMQKKGLVYL